MDKKRIGILTFHRALNYGAVWQTYALSHYLNLQGYDVKIIDYYSLYFREQNSSNPRNPINRLLKELVKPKFKSFINNRLDLTSKVFLNSEDLYENDGKFDIVIVGSDTVWNSCIVKEDLPIYLLSFVHKATKVSYAASLGGNELTEEIIKVFELYLPKFQFVSLRESLFQKQLQQFVKEPIQTVVDPTFLLLAEDYSKIIPHKVKFKYDYIVLFDLNGDELIRKKVIELKKKTNLPIINIGYSYRSYADKNLLGVSPEEWLSYIVNASFVCTNSFHGLTFSIIFKKQVISIAATNGFRANNNVRSENLLKSLSMEDYYIKSDNEINIKSIDYSSVQDKIEILREKSISFLKQIQ